MKRAAPHLVIITQEFAPQIGGVQNYLFEISRRIGQRWRTTIVTPVAGALPEPTDIARFVPKPANSLGYRSALIALRPTRVLVGHSHPQLLAAAALTAPRSYAAICYGNDYLAAQRRWHRPLFNFWLRKARPLLTISQANVRRMESIGLHGALAIRPGTDPTRFYPRTDRGVGAQLVLLSVCRLVPRKGLDRVIRSLPGLLRLFPDLVYLIVGDGPDRARLEGLVVEQNVGENVRFAGSVPDQELPAFYRNADLFVMPTREEPASASVEGFGITFLEASASGLAVVAGDSGGVAEAVFDGKTGILVPPNDLGALLAALTDLLGHPDRRLQMGQQGRAWVETEMNWDRAASEFAAALSMEDG